MKVKNLIKSSINLTYLTFTEFTPHNSSRTYIFSPGVDLVYKPDDSIFFKISILFQIDL